MKIHFNGCNFSSASGPNTFAGRLAQELSLRGHIIADPHDYDVGLVFIEPSTQLLPERPHVHRLDGIWFRPEEYVSHNRNIKIMYGVADHVIFQSNFDKQMVEKYWGLPKAGSVIHNGIKLEKVLGKNATLAELRTKYEKIFVCSSNWHAQKRLRDNIELFRHLRETKYPYSCLIIMGHGPDVRFADANVYYTGNLPHETCLEIYATADWMIHLAWLDHCPNVVVEALSQGCPVICASDGGTKEIVKSNGIVLKESVPYEFQLTDYDNPPRIDVTQISDLPQIDVKNEYLSIENIASEYERVFQRVLNQSL